VRVAPKEYAKQIEAARRAIDDIKN